MNGQMKREKQTLRQSLRELTAALPDAYIARSNRAIEANVLSLDVWKRANAVFVYVSMGREPDTGRLLQTALSDGKTLAVPLTFADGVMDARVIRSLGDLRPGRLGILEPMPNAAVLAPKQIDLIVAPCIAADQQGYRLGHGGGYYDRYLAHTSCPSLCLCRERLLQDTLVHNVYDIPMDQVVTEKRVIGTHKE